tara:strand:- start:12107 stop:12415 length:309 start_codon:yes stop_codon:yes gene_type:complete
MSRTILFLFFTLIFTSCQSFKDAGKVLRNEKTTTTDEFLIQKRKPLVLPPDFNKLPEPGTKTEANEKDEKKIQEILNFPREEVDTNKKKSSAEESILEKIRK